MDQIEKIIRENCWKFDKGYPDSQEDIDYLKTLIEQQLMIPFTPEEYANMIKKDTGVDIEDIDNEAELKIVFNKMSPDLKKRLKLDTPEKFQIGINKVLNIRSSDPILSILTDKKYNPIILKQYTNEISGLVEDIPDKDREKFLQYISNPSQQINFPKDKIGNLQSNLEKTGINKEIISRIIGHTTQDEGKKGVGMGELALSMLFKNISSATAGGDLSIDNGKFEIKGSPATLGEKPEAFKIDRDKLAKLGIDLQDIKGKTRSGKDKITTTMFVDGEKINFLNQFADIIPDLYSNSTDKKGFEDTLKDILSNDIKLGDEAVKARFDSIDFSDPNSIQKNIALMNFVRYANKTPGFDHFLIHDYGKGGSNEGEYIYVSGTPEDMAEELFNSEVEFEKIGPKNLRPRIYLK
tara:strand:- start:1652 stop:2878 length:1227 start_codon:yes stop_codon:yes gene_type:complete